MLHCLFFENIYNIPIILNRDRGEHDFGNGIDDLDLHGGKSYVWLAALWMILVTLTHWLDNKRCCWPVVPDSGRIDVTPFYVGCRPTILSRCFFDPISSTVVQSIIHTSTIHNRHWSSVSIITDTVVGDALLLLLLNRCCSSSSAAAYSGSCPAI